MPAHWKCSAASESPRLWWSAVIADRRSRSGTGQKHCCACRSTISLPSTRTLLLVPQWRTEQILEERRTAGHKGPLRVDFHGAAPACPFPVVADDGRRFEPVPDVHRHADRSPSRIPCGPKVVPKQPPAWLLLRPKAHRGDLFRWQHRSRACRVHSASVVSGPST